MQMDRIKLLKLADNILGKFLIQFCPSRINNNTVPGQEIKKILIIRPGGIGDLTLLLPAIHLLRSKFTTAEIDLLCEKRNSGIAALAEGINNVYLYDHGLDLIKCLRNRYDVVIDTEQWHRLSAVVTHLTGASIKIGFDTNERRKVYTHKIPYSHDDYEVYSFLNLFKPLVDNDMAFDENKPFLTVAQKERDKTVAIFPGASIAERRWSTEKFSEVAKTFSNLGYKILLLGSKKETKAAEAIKKSVPACIDFTSKLDLKGVAGVLAASKLLLTTDSGLMHLSYAVGTPTVSLFGSGIETKWAPRGRKDLIINKHLACSPCTKFGYTPACDRNIECLSLISANEVISAMEKLLR